MYPCLTRHDVKVISNAVYNTTDGVMVQGSEQVNVIGQHTVKLDYLPQWFHVDAVENFLEINIVDYMGCLMFLVLFNDVAKCTDVWSGTSPSGKPACSSLVAPPVVAVTVVCILTTTQHLQSAESSLECKLNFVKSRRLVLFFFLRLLIALATLSLDISHVQTRGWKASKVLQRSAQPSWKCATHRASCSLLKRAQPSLLLIGTPKLLPELVSSLTILYSVFMLFFSAVSCATVSFSSSHLLLSFQLFFTSLLGVDIYQLWAPPCASADVVQFIPGVTIRWHTSSSGSACV